MIGNGSIQSRLEGAFIDCHRAMLQIILLFTIIPLAASLKKRKDRIRTNRPSKRTRHGRSDAASTAKPSPQDEPSTALEMLMDRLSIWAAVADLNLDVILASPSASGQGSSKGSGTEHTRPRGKGKEKEREEDGIGAVLRRFWDEVLVPL